MLLSIRVIPVGAQSATQHQFDSLHYTLMTKDGDLGGGGSDNPQVVEIIDNPRQAGDKCTLMDVCVPLPISQMPDRLVFPRCIELPQCVGACCDAENKCHADQKILVEFNVSCV